MAIEPNLDPSPHDPGAAVAAESPLWTADPAAQPYLEPSAPVAAPAATASSSPVLPTPLVERLERLENVVETLTRYVRPGAPPGPAPEGYTPLPPAQSPIALSYAADQAAQDAAAAGAANHARTWHVLPVLNELRRIGQMYLEPRYQLSRTAKFGVPAIIIALVLNYLFFNMLFTIPIISPIFERLIILVLALVLYKIMERELSRYQNVLNYLARFVK